MLPSSVLLNERACFNGLERQCCTSPNGRRPSFWGFSEIFGIFGRQSEIGHQQSKISISPNAPMPTQCVRVFVF
jgi:hypothetical protein